MALSQDWMALTWEEQGKKEETAVRLENWKKNEEARKKY